MSRDLREYSRQTEIRLAIGAVVLLLLVGDGLIYLIYGREAAMLGLLCIFSGLLPLGVIFLVFLFLDWVLKRANPD